MRRAAIVACLLASSAASAQPHAGAPARTPGDGVRLAAGVAFEPWPVSLMRQIRACWFTPSGWGGDEWVTFRIVVSFGRDGAVTSIGEPVYDEGRRSRLALGVAGARRAIASCAPYRLPAEAYDGPTGWNPVEIRLDTRSDSPQ